MQVFVPFLNPFKCAGVLDPRRFNKQIIECEQILKAIRGESTAWANHPCVLMYREHEEWLQLYLNTFECYKAYKNTLGSDRDEALLYLSLAEEWGKKAVSVTPRFFCTPFFQQHRKRLYTKDPKYYVGWHDLGTSDENWYAVNGKLLVYKDGRLVETRKL